MKEYEEDILTDLKDLGIDIKKEYDFNNITKLKEEYIFKILSTTFDDEKIFKEILEEYLRSIDYFYFKIINNKIFYNTIEDSGFKNFKKIYYSSIPLTKKMKTFKDHPVLYGYYKAWVNHCPISISPNVIWQLILNGIIKVINDNSEQLRDNFVDFRDKRTLKLEKYKDKPVIENEDWEEFIDDISKQIKENTKSNIYDNIILNFTTNTKDLLLVQQISSMSMFQKYFDYEFYAHSVCGFPYIELEGEIEDWELILNKIQNFKNLTVEINFGIEDLILLIRNHISNSKNITLKNWIKVIEKIIKKIIDSKKGKIDIEFWKNLIVYNEAKNFLFGCGGVKPEDFAMIGFSGWISNFFPFNNKGDYLYKEETDSIYNSITIFKSDTKNLISEINETPMKFHLDLSDNKKIDLNLTIYSGILGLSQDPDTFLVKPELGYFIADNSEFDYGKIIPILNQVTFENSWNISDL